MTGDKADIAARLRRYMPPWFGSALPTPVLDALLGGIAAAWADVYALIQFARAQTRIASSTGGWIDLTAWSFLGDLLPRFRQEKDPAYVDRVRREIFRDRNTKPAAVQLLTELCGVPPDIYEGWYAPHNGGRGGGRLAYSRAGRWGSRTLPGVVIFTIPLPQNFGIPDRGGWSSTTPGGAAVGGRGAGNFSYTDNSMISGSGPSQLEILQRLESIRTDGIKYLVVFTPPVL